MTARSRHDHQLVPFSTFEPLLSQIRQALNCNNAEALQHIGYAGGIQLAGWRNADKAPSLAINAAKGILAELGLKAAAPAAPKQFTVEELSRLFALCIGVTLPKEQLAPLIAKLAREMQEPQP